MVVKGKLKEITCSAKKVALAVPKTVVNVPITIGRTILAAPDAVKEAVTKAQSKGQNASDDAARAALLAANEDKKPKHADKLEFICREILEEQERNGIVRQSQSDCMNEIVSHLEIFLREKPDAIYEEWISELHPENAEYVEANRIDHRFYVEESDHRVVWNECMKMMTMHSGNNDTAVDRNWSDRVVETRSMDPSYNRTT